VHDDIIDGAAVRRGEPTTIARHGLATAVVLGDHLLAAGYRLAAGTGSLAFIDRFAGAVQRTIEGEMDQARMRGATLDRATSESIAARKSGELFGLAVATWPLLVGHPEAVELFSLGRRVGLFYQQVDDFLDFCPAAMTGKAPLMDYRGRFWTWPMHELPDATFGEPAATVAASFFASGAARRCLERLRDEGDDLVAHLSAHLPGDSSLRKQVLQWLREAQCAAAAGPTSAVGKRVARRLAGGSRPDSRAATPGDQLPAATTSAHATGAALAVSIRTTEWVPR
jgi:geranylgeranyl pyrophosphate synthase